MKKKYKKRENPLSKEVFEFLKERRLMLESGFPYCYVENFVPMHCDTCRSFYKKRLETHTAIVDENVVIE